MRLVFAIVSFVAAAVMLAFGIAERVAPEPTTQYSYQVTTTGTAPLTVIDGSVLNAIQGRQTLTIAHTGDEATISAPVATATTGSAVPTATATAIAPADQVVAAYARTPDVMAWVGAAPYNEIAFQDAAGSACEPDPLNPGDCELVAIQHPGTETVVPDPYGDDLWIDSYEDPD